MSTPTLRAHNVTTLEDRINVLRGLVWLKEGGLRDPAMRKYGLMITQACPARNDMCELKAIFDFVVQNVRYTGDITGRDTFQSALRTMQFGGGDCDDHAALSAVLGMENGFTMKWRITSNAGTSWDHIYAMAGVPKHRPTRWVALDTTLGASRFTHEPPRAKYQDFLVDPDNA